VTSAARLIKNHKVEQSPKKQQTINGHHTRGEGTITNSSEGRRHRHEEEDWKSWSGPIGIKKTYLEPDVRSAPGLDVNPTTTTSETSISC